jgi:lysophospholipase L1-like esterase
MKYVVSVLLFEFIAAATGMSQSIPPAGTCQGAWEQVWAGDSITYFWTGGMVYRPLWWQENIGVQFVNGTKEQDPCVGNFGASGRTTYDIQNVFEPRLLAYGSKVPSNMVLVLLIGTNDIAHSPLAPMGQILDDNAVPCVSGQACKRTLDFSLSSVESRYDAIVQWAKLYQWPMVVGTVPPVVDNYQEPIPLSIGRVLQFPSHDIGWRNALIALLNLWIWGEAQKNGLEVADYYGILVDPETGRAKPEYYKDFVHPNDAGYDLMAPVVLAAIARASAAHQSQQENGLGQPPVPVKATARSHNSDSN